MCSISKDEPQTSHSVVEKLKKKHWCCQFCALGYNLCDNCDFSADQTADFWARSCLSYDLAFTRIFQWSAPSAKACQTPTTRTWTSLWRFGCVPQDQTSFFWGNSTCNVIVVSIFCAPASSKHCASLGTVCETGRAEWRERLHVCQVSSGFLFMAGILHINQFMLQIIQG